MVVGSCKFSDELGDSGAMESSLVSRCRSLGFWCRVDLQVDADVSEKHAVSIFRG
jgi:hypothetical protein